MTEPAFDPSSALIVTDLQNDFASPGGSLYVAGGEEVVPVVNRLIERALAGGAFVAYTQDWHPEHTPHFERDGGVWPVHCVQGTWGSAFHPDLRVEGEVVRKGSGGEDGYSGFSLRDPRTGQVGETVLGELLQEHAVRRLIVTGIAADYCVKETALDGLRLGFVVEVLREAVRAVDLQPGDGDRALLDVEAAGGRLL
jgi:nicotinamidase/pyrazinamidase